MGLLNQLFGNADAIDLKELEKEFADIILPDEKMELAYKIMRDKWVFTDKRLILLDVQGVTGSKREYLSIPYSNISYFSGETAGSFDGDCELDIWIKGGGHVKKEFSRNTNIKAIQKALASKVLG